MRHFSLSSLSLLAATLCFISPAEAQGFRQAIPGMPFGVAQFTVPLPPEGVEELISTDGFLLSERNGRALYPSFSGGQFQGVVNEFLGGNRIPLTPQLTVMFLFTGSEPLELTLHTPTPQSITLHPDGGKARWYRQSLQRWWQAYHNMVKRQVDDGDYPPLIQTYLTSMLSQRLGLETPWFIQRRQASRSELEQSLQRLSGAEELRHDILRETMQGGPGLTETANLPVPEDVAWTPLDLPNPPADVGIEPMAFHVPEECFYIRFGNFENYLWLNHLTDEHGGDISRMVTLRGHDARLSEKLQQQLALEQTALAEVVGPQVIADVALIGRDLYLREGAACGMLFQARNGPLLGADIAQKRQSAQRRFQDRGATLETVTIAGHDVTFLWTPDNHLRSFYAVDGDFHLVTTSSEIVRRFYEVGQGQGALASAPEFQNARLEMPLTRDDTIFAYFSSAFFRGLMSPHYQIELTRRLQSVTDMELVQLAMLAAAGEGQRHESMDDLISGGFLPAGFGQRHGAERRVVSDATYLDPVRGARGTFTPIPDVPIDSITPTEASLFERSAQFCRSSWPQMDPLMVGIRRFALDEGDRMERIVIDANVSPLVEEKYGWLLSMVGPATDVEIQSDPDDAIKLQMTLKGGLLWPDIPTHHLFLGIQDTAQPSEVVPTGFRRTFEILKSTPGYLGAWPQLGLLDLFPFLAGQPDAAGFSPLPLGVWRWQGGGFSVLSLDQSVLAEAAQHLSVAPTDNPAQIRLRVSDLTQTHLASHVTRLNFSRAYQASQGNVRLLNTVTQQLQVDPASARSIVEELLDTTLLCSLGGKYEYTARTDGESGWRSTAWPAVPGQLPDDYTPPLLTWFRGASADLTKIPGRVFFRATVDMQRSEREPAVKLPLFDLFKGGIKMPGALEPARDVTDGQTTP